MPPTKSGTSSSEFLVVRKSDSGLISNIACPVAISRFTPAELAEVIGPGTPHTCRPIALAQLEVDRAPERSAASTTTVWLARAAIRRLRIKKYCLRAKVPGGTSLITKPVDPIRSSRPWIRNINTTGKNRNGCASSCQCAPMRCGINPKSSARDYTALVVCRECA